MSEAGRTTGSGRDWPPEGVCPTEWLLQSPRLSQLTLSLRVRKLQNLLFPLR